MFDAAPCNLWSLYQQEIFILKYFDCFSPYSYVSDSYVPFAPSGAQDQIIHNNLCQQHNHAAVMSFFNHFYIEPSLTHII